MTSKLSALILISLSSLGMTATPAMAFDQFFGKESRHFIKIDSVKSGASTYVKFAACDVNANAKTAKCKDITQVNQSQFSKMRGCETRWMIADATLGTLSGGAAVALIVGSVMSGGSMSPLAAGFIMTAGTASYAEFDNAKIAYQKKGIYSEKNQMDIDWVTTRMDYDTFVAYLTETSSQPSREDKEKRMCNSFAYTQPTNKAPYMISLTEKQQKMLAQAENQ